MKKYVLSVLILTLGVSFLLSRYPAETSSDIPNVQQGRPMVGQAVAFGTSQEVRRLSSPAEAVPRTSSGIPVRELGVDSKFGGILDRAHDTDSSLAIFDAVEMPQPLLSFPGLSNIDNAQVHSLLIIPPDMNGDVGPNHYFQVVNSLLRVFDKTGQPMSPAFKISDLFASLG